LTKPTQEDLPEPAPISTNGGNGRGDKGADVLLARELADLARAQEGTRNDTLNRAAYVVGGLVGAGRLSESEVVPALETVARSTGLPENETARTSRSGLEAGKAAPLYGRPAPPARTGTGTEAASTETATLPTVDVAVIRDCLYRGETGDGDLLTALYHGSIVYDHAEGAWYTWGGQHWTVDKTNGIYRHVSDHVAAQYLALAADARNAGKDEMAKEALGRALALRNRRRVENVLFLAARPHLGVTGEDWDKDPWRLAVANGVLDLQTGTLCDGLPGDWIKTAAPVDWHGPDAPCPQWEKFLSEIFNSNEETIGFMQRFLGYSLTGLTVDHVFPILWGECGRNGKGTLLETLADVLGSDLTTSTQADALMDVHQSAGGGPQPFVFALRGKRLVWASETNEGRRINASLIKLLTGGDRLNVRTLHTRPVEFKPTHKILLLTNTRPHIPASDKAVWERVVLLPFTERFVDDPDPANPHDHERNPHLREQLNTEGPGILAWLVRGCLDWQKAGLCIPAHLGEATKGYRKLEDTFGQFIAECCVEGAGLEARAGALYNAYHDWAGQSAMSKTAFGLEMSKRGVEREKRNSGWWYVGIGPMVTERDT